MESVNAADGSCPLRVKEQGLYASANSTAAAAATSKGLSQQYLSSPRPTLERYQTCCTSTAVLQEHHHALPELRQNQRQQNRRSLVFHAPQRRHSASEYFAEHPPLSNPSEKPQQRQSQQSSLGQLNSTQQQEPRSCAPTQQSVQRRWLPFPSQKRVSESARFHDCTAGQSACFRPSNSPRSVTANLQHYSSSETSSIRSGSHNSSSSSISIRAGGGTANSNSRSSTRNTPVGGSLNINGNSCSSPDLKVKFPSDHSNNRNIRTSSCTTRQFLHASACLDTLRSWSSETLFPAEGETVLIQQADEERTAIHEAAAENAAAAAVRSAARAAAASAAAQREAQAAARTESAQREPPPGGMKAAALHTEAETSGTSACSRVTILSRATTTDEAVIIPITCTGQTGELMRGNTGNGECNGTIIALSATKAISPEKHWKLGESIWAAGIVRSSGLAKYEDTAMLTLSAELDQATSSDAVAIPAAGASTPLAVADASGVAAYNPPEISAPRDTSADAGGPDAPAVPSGSAAVTATLATASAAVPQLASFLQFSPEAAPGADLSASPRAHAAATSAAALRAVDISVEDDASPAAGALESPFIRTTEDDAHPASTLKSSCACASPKSCYTSHSNDEAQHLLLLHEDQEPLLEEYQWVDNHLLAGDLEKQQTEQNLSHQPPTQLAQHWPRGEISPQVDHTDLQNMQEPRQQRQLQYEPRLQQREQPHRQHDKAPQQHEQPHQQHKPHLREYEQSQQQHEPYHQQQEDHQRQQEQRHGPRWRPQSQSERENQLVPEQQDHQSVHISLSVPSRCAADAEIPSCAGFCLDERPSPSDQMPQQPHVREKQHPRTDQQEALTRHQEEETVRRSHQRLSVTVHHQQHRLTLEHFQQPDAQQQPLQPAKLEQSDDPERLSSEQATEGRKDEQREPVWRRKEQDEKPERQQQLQQSSNQQGWLAGEKEDDQRSPAGPCYHEQESVLREQATALRELQHLVQQQQAQLQQVVQQQTLMLQQLLHRQSSADPPAAQFSGEGTKATKPVHSTVAENAAAKPPAAEGLAAATFRVTSPVRSSAASAQLAPVTVPQVSAEAVHAPVSGLMAAATLFAAGPENHSRTTSVERYCCIEDLQTDEREASESISSEQRSQCRVQSQAAHLRAETPEGQANQLHQNIQHDTNPSILQLRHEDPQDQQAHQLLYAKKLLQGEQQLQGRPQEEPTQNTVVHLWPQLRENHQQRLCEKNRDKRQQNASGDNEDEALHCSPALLHQPLQPPLALLSPQVLLSRDEPSTMHQMVCGVRKVLVRSSPAAATARNAYTAPTACTALHAAPESTSAEASAVAAAVPAEPLTGARASVACPATAARRKEKTLVQGAASSVRAEQQWDVSSSSLALQQQQGRCRNITATIEHQALSRSSSNASEPLITETSFSRLSTNAGSQKHVQHHREPSSPRLLPRHSLPLFHYSTGAKDERNSLTTGDEGAFEKAAAAMPVFLAADKRVQQRPICAPELLRQQQRELQRKLRLLQVHMQQMQQEQQQREQQQKQHVTLDVPFVAPHQRRSTGADSPLSPQLPFLLNNSLQRILQEQHCEQVHQKQQGAPHHYKESSQIKPSTIFNQRYKRTNRSSSGSAALTDSRGRSSSKDVLLQRSHSSGCSTVTARTDHSSLATNALHYKCCMPAALPVVQHEHLLLGEAATPNAMPQVAAVERPIAEGTRKMQPEECSAHESAEAAPAIRAPAATLDGTLLLPDDTCRPLSPASVSNFHLLPYAYLPGDSSGRSVAAGPALFSSAASAPAVSLSTQADLSGEHRCSSTQQQGKVSGSTASVRAYDSLLDMPGDHVCYPFAAGAATVEGYTLQQQHLKDKERTIPVQALGRASTAGENDPGEQSKRAPPYGSQPTLLKQLALHRPPLILPGLQDTLQQQGALQETGHSRAGLTPQHGPRRILDQDEQIVPSVLKRILLQQQQQEKRGETNGQSMFSASLALQQHHETCWWEEAASSRTPAKKQQQHHQGQVCRRVSASEQHPKQRSKRSIRSHVEGAFAAANTNRRPNARQSGEKDAERTPASRQQLLPHQKFEKRRTVVPCCSGTQASTSSSGKHLNSTSSNQNIASRQNSNRNRRNSNCKSLTSGQRSAGRVIASSHSPISTTKITQQNSSRVRALQQKDCSCARYSSHQTAASPQAPAAADSILLRTEETGGCCVPVYEGCAAATSPCTESVLLTSSAANAKGYLGPSVEVAPDQSRYSTGHPVSSATASKTSVPCKSVGADAFQKQSSTDASHGCGKSETCAVFSKTADEESGSCGRYMQQQGGRAHFEEEQMPHFVSSCSFNEAELYQRNDTGTFSTALHRRFEERQVGTVSNTIVERRSGDAYARSGFPAQALRSRQQERQRLQQTERLPQVSQQQPVRRTQGTSQPQRQLHQETQRRALDVEKHRAATEDGNELQLNGEVGAFATPPSRLLHFLEIPQHSRPARGQETAALVRLFLSQQEQLSTAAVTASGCRWKRNTGNGIPFLKNDSLFCLEHLKHLREDFAGDAYYVKTMAELLQRYDELTTVD